MAHEYLGSEFDIHCGGMDLVFRTMRMRSPRPAPPGTDSPPLAAQRLGHHGREKMSKSLGNVLAIPAVLQRVRPAELRWPPGQCALPVDAEFTETALQDAARAYSGLEEFLHRVRTRVGGGSDEVDREVRRRPRRRPGGAGRARRGARHPRRGQLRT